MSMTLEMLEKQRVGIEFHVGDRVTIICDHPPNVDNYYVKGCTGVVADTYNLNCFGQIRKAYAVIIDGRQNERIYQYWENEIGLE